MLKIIASIFLVAVLSNANELDKAIEMSKDPTKAEKASELLLELAMQGNKKAMTQLGRGYIYGKGVKQDCRKGFWFLLNALSKEGAQNQDPEALKEIALMFNRGLCVKKDNSKYIKYLKRYEDLKLKQSRLKADPFMTDFKKGGNNEKEK